MFIWAHRGASGWYDENTQAAFTAAIEKQADGIEMDVLLFNGKPVVLHEPWLERTTGTQKYLDELSEFEFSQLLTPSGEKIVTLEQALDKIKGRCQVNLELKDPACEQAVLSVIRQQVKLGHFAWQDFLISSFDHQLLQRMVHLAPQLRYAALIGHIPLNLSATLKPVSYYSVHCDLAFINASLVEQAHDMGLKVYVYTVNRPREIQLMKQLKVDGYFTDYPGVVF